MKLLLSILVVFLALAEVFCEEVGQNEDLNHWANNIQIQDEWLASDPLNEILKRITRKPRPRQFFGLMGKRSYGQKLNSFVSLMGKRSQEEPDMYEWRIQN
ncbi:protachykinin isoform X2 [Anguilla anguilla]|uniref:protachykinin isoform X2 n=1 Tax=Anguilla anguilla TaxID=7936 RepID=UPI0015B1C2B9|nr:protachykinin isoform X2 [Anguilla anguilla]